MQIDDNGQRANEYTSMYTGLMGVGPAWRLESFVTHSLART